MHEDHPKEAVCRNRKNCIRQFLMNFRNLTWGQMGKVQPPKKRHLQLFHQRIQLFTVIEHHPKEAVC